MILFDNRLVSLAISEKEWKSNQFRNVLVLALYYLWFWLVWKVAGFCSLDPQIVVMQMKYNNYAIASYKSINIEPYAITTFVDPWLINDIFNAIEKNNKDDSPILLNTEQWQGNHIRASVLIARAAKTGTDKKLQKTRKIVLKKLCFSRLQTLNWPTKSLHFSGFVSFVRNASLSFNYSLTRATYSFNYYSNFERKLSKWQCVFTKRLKKAIVST